MFKYNERIHYVAFAILLTTYIHLPDQLHAQCPFQITGDLDCDCDVDANDASLLIGRLVHQQGLGSCPEGKADTNGDGLIDSADIGTLIEAYVATPTSIWTVDTWDDLRTAAGNYSPGDTIRLNALDFDGSDADNLLLFANGDLTIDWNTANDALATEIDAGGLILIDVGSYGLKFTNSMHFESEAPIAVMRTSALADNHVVQFDPEDGDMTVNIANWQAIHNGVDASAARSCFSFEIAGIGSLEATLLRCTAFGATNDGFSLRDSTVVNLNDCEASGCGDEAASPHDASILNINGGLYVCASPVGNVVASGVGANSINISGGTFIGTNTQTCFTASDYSTITIMDAMLEQHEGGRLLRADDHASIFCSSSTISIGSGCHGWDNTQAYDNICTLVDCDIEIPTFASSTMFGARIENANLIRCAFDMRGKSIGSFMTAPNQGETWTIMDCVFIGGDIPGGIPSPVFSAYQGTLNFYRNLIDLSEWVTHESGNYRGYVGGHHQNGKINVEGCIFFGLPNQGLGTSRRTIICVRDASTESAIINNTIYCTNNEPVPTSIGIYYAPDLTTVRGNIVAGNFKWGILENGAGTYHGMYNWATGAQSDNIFGTPGIGDIEGGPFPIFVDASLRTIAGFALADDETTGRLAVPEAAYQQQPWSTHIDVDPPGSATILYTPLLVWGPESGLPDREPVAAGEDGIDYGAVVNRHIAPLQVEVIAPEPGTAFLSSNAESFMRLFSGHRHGRT